MRKKQKKGFTIVELVVVIAVIAILAAVLIPTFVNLIHKAEFSNDQALVRNINTTLAISAEGKDGKPTMYQTLEDVKEGGFVVENLTPRSSGSDIVWDEEHNQFVLVYENGTKYFTGTQWDKNLNTKKMWKIYTTMPASSNYSVYLAGTTYNQAVTVSGVGFDAGNNTNIPSVTYTNTTGNAENVTIRTNGGELVVNAPSDTVNHYGDAQVVTLTAVGNHSYYEHGSVNLVDLKKGRLVITNDATAEVGSIYLTATENNYDGIVLATMSGATLPEVVTREAVDLPAAGQKKLVAVVEQVNSNGVADATKTENIYLYAAQTAYEETKGYTGVSELGTLVLEAPTGTGSFTIKVKDGNTEKEVTVNYADLDESVTEEKTQDLETATLNSFTKPIGEGTEINPYKIYTANAWLEILKMGVENDYIFGDDSGTKITYVSIENDLDFKNVTEWPGDVDVSFYNVHVNGNNHNFKNARIHASYATGVCYLMSSNNEWKDLNLVNCTGAVCYGTYYNDANAKAVFDNVNIFSGSAKNGFYGRYCGYSTTEIYNCTIDSNSVATQTGFAGGGFLGNTGNGHFLIQNCVNHGTVIGNGDNFGPFVGQGCSSKTDGKYWGLVKDSTFDGTLIAYGSSATKIRLYATYAEGENVDYSNCTIIVPNVSTAKVSLGNGDSYVSAEVKESLNIIASSSIKFDNSNVVIEDSLLKIVELNSDVKRLEVKQYVNYNLKKTDGTVAPHYNFIAKAETVDCSSGMSEGETLFSMVDVLQVVGSDTSNRKTHNTTDTTHSGLYEGVYYFNAITNADGSYNYLAVDGPNGSISGFITIYAYGENDVFLGSAQIAYNIV